MARHWRERVDAAKDPLLVGLLALVATAASGQPSDPAVVAPTPILAERLQVTSVDLWVGVDRGPLGARPDLQRDELDLRLAGKPARIDDVDHGGTAQRPRRVVVFIDTVLGDQTSVRWSASRLAERAAELAAIGEVEVVIADPDPRVVVAATRDVDRLHDALSRLALFAGTEAAIPLLRDEFLDASDDEDDPELAASFVADETALVERRQDLLLRWLIDGASGHGAERASTSSVGGVLLYVSQGFDLDPERFYLGAADEDGALRQETTSWVRTLAAYGWTCAPLVYEDRRALLRRGLRIGKWRFGGPRGKLGGPLVLLSASHEADRDAEKAAALVELGDTLLASGDNEQASETFLRAIHHFYGDPRTRSGQAYAWRRLALALELAGEVDPARRAFANALELDPAVDDDAQRKAPATMRVDGFDAMATETGGHLLLGSKDLLSALEEIAHRQRLSFTLPGSTTGALLLVELTAKSHSSPLHFSRWSRSGAPERIAAARLRQFLDAAANEPTAESPVRVHITTDPNGNGVATLSLPASDEDKTRRVLLGTAGEDRAPRVVTLAPHDTPPSSWRGEIETVDDTLVAAVYTEDLVRGDWDIALVSLVSE